MSVRSWPKIASGEGFTSVSFAEFRPSNFDIEIRLVMARLQLGIFHRTPERCFIFLNPFASFYVVLSTVIYPLPHIQFAPVYMLLL